MGGEFIMEALPRDIELQRVMNLVRGFGWEKVKEEMRGGVLSLTIEKRILPEEEVTAGGVPS